MYEGMIYIYWFWLFNAPWPPLDHSLIASWPLVLGHLFASWTPLDHFLTTSRSLLLVSTKSQPPLGGNLTTIAGLSTDSWCLLGVLLASSCVSFWDILCSEKKDSHHYDYVLKDELRTVCKKGEKVVDWIWASPKYTCQDDGGSATPYSSSFATFMWLQSIGWKLLAIEICRKV